MTSDLLSSPLSSGGIAEADLSTVRRVLITGVTGFIGGHLAERLLRLGVAVRGLARRPSAAGWLADQGAEVIAGDLLDPGSLEPAAAGCDVVVHAAAWTGGAEGEALGWAVNVDGTAHLLRAAASASVRRFVYVSSVAVYGLNRSPVVDEAAATPPVGQLYPDSKIAAEGLVREAHGRGLEAVVVRPACTYGPRGVAWTISVVEQIKAGRLVLLGEDRGLVNTGYIDNVVDGLLLAMAHPAAAGEAFNLCDGTAVTYRQFYLRYAAMLGLHRLPTYPAWLARGAASSPGRLARRLLGRRPVGPWSYHFRFNPSRFSIEKAARLLGYRPAVDFDEGMRRTEAWLRRAGYLEPTR
ncbi:MAG: NAD-dependent epimerase/dehydratase family protein [Caldilineales bacterium]|nr:NAD-dependent epimerase/dehydratase family protein [Caldilineales bacterium]MDW8317030.1 NAD-dependent epimerase/dehydratase family protein [Anaerolineae bacterium]